MAVSMYAVPHSTAPMFVILKGEDHGTESSGG
jgi:hypothetical protein